MTNPDASSVQATNISRLLILILVLVVLTLPSCNVKGENTGRIRPNPPKKYRIFKTISGAELTSTKYSLDSIIGKTFDNIVRIRAIAFANLEERLGIKYEDKKTILVRLKDIGIKGARGKGILMAQRVTEQGALGERIVVQLFNEYIVMKMTDPQEELNHEITHGVMRELLGKTAYIQLPKWFREGTAVYCARQGSKKMDAIFMSSFSSDLSRFIDGLDGKHSFADYAEDYLAFEYIEKKHSVEKLKQIVNKVVFGKMNYQAAIAETLEIPYIEFKSNAKKYATAQAEKWLERTTSIKKYYQAKREYSSKNYSGCISTLNSINLDNINPFLFTGIKYYAARCNMLQKKTEASNKLFKFVQSRSAYTNFVDRSFYYPAYSNYTKIMQAPDSTTADQFRECEQGFISIVNNLPYSSFASNSLYFLGHLYKKFSFYEPSCEFFVRYIDTFPRGGFVQPSNLNAAICYLELDNKDLAFKYATAATEGKSKRIAENARELLAKIQGKEAD